jgi:hypothetical protein
MKRVYSKRKKCHKIQMPLKALGNIEPGDKIAMYSDFHIDLYAGGSHGLSHESEIELAHKPKNAKSLENLQVFFKNVKDAFDKDQELYTDCEDFIGGAIGGMESLLETYENISKEKNKVHFIKKAIQVGKSL